jgi:hypothetical protein
MLINILNTLSLLLFFLITYNTVTNIVKISDVAKETRTVALFVNYVLLGQSLVFIYLQGSWALFGWQNSGLINNTEAVLWAVYNWFNAMTLWAFTLIVRGWVFWLHKEE